MDSSKKLSPDFELVPAGMGFVGIIDDNVFRRKKPDDVRAEKNRKSSLAENFKRLNPRL